MTRVFTQSVGVVESFDERAGLGVIRDQSGDLVRFHCVSIEDGTRRIDVGRQVTFTSALVLGRIEANHIRPA